MTISHFDPKEVFNEQECPKHVAEMSIELSELLVTWSRRPTTQLNDISNLLILSAVNVLHANNVPPRGILKGVMILLKYSLSKRGYDVEFVSMNEAPHTPVKH